MFDHFVGLALKGLIIVAPSNIFALMFGPSSGLVKPTCKMNLIMLDFFFAGQGLPCSDK